MGESEVLKDRKQRRIDILARFKYDRTGGCGCLILLLLAAALIYYVWNR